MLNIYKHNNGQYEMDLSSNKEAIMTKTVMGWRIEVSANESWDSPTVFYWIEATAKAAFKECYRYLRDTGIRNRRKW